MRPKQLIVKGSLGVIASPQKRLVILLSAEDHHTLQRVVELATQEVQWFHRVERQESEKTIVYQLHGTYLPPQYVTSSEVETTTEHQIEYHQYLEKEFGDVQANAILEESNAWCHSHVNMEVKPSLQDIATFKRQVERAIQEGRMVAQLMLIVNKRGEFYTRIWDPLLGMDFHFENVEVHTQQPYDTSQIEKIFEEHVRQKPKPVEVENTTFPKTGSSGSVSTTQNYGSGTGRNWDPGQKWGGSSHTSGESSDLSKSTMGKGSTSLGGGSVNSGAWVVSKEHKSALLGALEEHYNNAKDPDLTWPAISRVVDSYLYPAEWIGLEALLFADKGTAERVAFGSFNQGTPSSSTKARELMKSALSLNYVDHENLAEAIELIIQISRDRTFCNQSSKVAALDDYIKERYWSSDYVKSAGVAKESVASDEAESLADQTEGAIQRGFYGED